MPDEIIPETKPGEGTGADPKTTVTPPAVPFDTSKIGDEDFDKIFDDPRLYKHSRFSTLNEKAKKAKEYEDAEEARKIEEQKKKGEWEAVAKTAEEKRVAAEQKFQTAQIDNRILTEAAKLGVVDSEAVIKLIDRANVKMDENGTITGADEAVKSLLESKPYLKGTGATPIVGGQTAPGTETQAGLKRFKLSQIQDAVFYRENEKDILASMRANLVEDDTPK